jgi:hypothetical protein
MAAPLYDSRLNIGKVLQLLARQASQEKSVKSPGSFEKQTGLTTPILNSRIITGTMSPSCEGHFMRSLLTGRGPQVE